MGNRIIDLTECVEYEVADTNENEGNEAHTGQNRIKNSDTVKSFLLCIQWG